MIDVDATLAAIKTTLEAHNALPERAECDSCSQSVPGRDPQIVCGGCGAKVPTEAVRMEVGEDGVWRLGVRQNPISVGIRQNAKGEWECVPCMQATAAAEKAAADKAEADAK